MDASPSDALAALTPVVEVLEGLGVAYHVGGSLASSAYGRPRATADVDLVAELNAGRVRTFVEQLQSDYYVDEEAVLEAVERRGSFNVIHLGTMVKVDVFVPEDRPFERQEMSRAVQKVLDVVPDARAFPLKSPEDLVLRKLDWFRAGGEVSQQQWSDVLGVLKLQAGRLDHEYLTRWAEELQLTELLDRALTEAEQQS